MDSIIKEHVVSIKNDFKINIKEVDKNIPLLNWVSKQHKNPYIAGASNCATKTVSVQLSLALKLIKNHFKNYCNTITNSMVTA